jgi:hypothetical protein
MTGPPATTTDLRERGKGVRTSEPGLIRTGGLAEAPMLTDYLVRMYRLLSSGFSEIWNG